MPAASAPAARYGAGQIGDITFQPRRGAAPRNRFPLDSSIVRVVQRGAAFADRVVTSVGVHVSEALLDTGVVAYPDVRLR